MKTAVMALALALASSYAYADGVGRFGLGVGRAQVDFDDYGVKGDGTSWEALAGWEFNKYLAVEASYIYSGNIEDTVSVSGIGDVKLRANTKAITASVIGSLPIGDRFSVFARAGLLHWDSDLKGSVPGFSATASADGDDLLYGVGATAMVESALLRLEYRGAQIEDADLSLLTLSIVWRFGG